MMLIDMNTKSEFPVDRVDAQRMTSSSRIRL